MTNNKWRFNPANFKIEHLWVAAPFFVIIVRAFRKPLPLLDFWWHVEMGKIIVSTHSIPRTDLFSFTAAGKPFIVQNWLAEALYYLIHQLGGLPLLVFLNAALLALALLPVFLICRGSTSQIRIAALSSLLAGLAFTGNARPQVFSLVLLGFFYWILDDYRFRRRDRAWLLPIVMILWSNLHGAFVIGLGLIAIYLISEGILRLASPSREDILSARKWKKLALIFIACIAASMLNPETFKIYDYVHTILSNQAVQHFVMEWQAPRIDTLTGIQTFFGLFGLALAGLIYSRKRPHPTDLALFLAFSILGLAALRNANWFAVIIAPILARYWSEVKLSGPLEPLDRLLFSNSIPQVGQSDAQPARPGFILNLFLALIGFTVLIASSPWIRQIQDRASLLDPQTPVSAVDYIQRQALRGHIFHPQIFGDYLLWRLYPQQRSFIDGRVHLFGEDFVRDYEDLFYDSHWEEKLVAYDIRYLLLSKDKEQVDSHAIIRKARSSGNWKVLFEDAIAILFAKIPPEAFKR